MKGKTCYLMVFICAMSIITACSHNKIEKTSLENLKLEYNNRGVEIKNDYSNLSFDREYIINIPDVIFSFSGDVKKQSFANMDDARNNLKSFLLSKYDLKVDSSSMNVMSSNGLYLAGYTVTKDTDIYKYYVNGLYSYGVIDESISGELLEGIENVECINVDRGEEAINNKYMLKDKEVGIEEAIRYCDSYLDSYKDYNNPDEELRVKTVFVGKVDDDYVYRFIYERWVKGVALCSENNNTNENILFATPTYVVVIMDASNHVYGVNTWNSNYYTDFMENKSDSEYVTLDSAIKILHDSLDGEEHYKINDIKFKYACLTSLNEKGLPVTKEYVPVWAFTLDEIMQEQWEIDNPVEKALYRALGLLYNSNSKICKMAYINAENGEISFVDDLHK